MDNSCTATEIAASNPEVCSVHDAHTAADWLAERGYDSAPVLKDDRPVGYVTRDAAEDAPSDESVTDIMEPLQLMSSSQIILQLMQYLNHCITDRSITSRTAAV